MKTRLLVSVRDCQEAQDALAGGADLIDVKEPRRGALGAVDAAILSQIIDAVVGRVPVSAALGELLVDSSDTIGAISAGVALAKFGLSGCRDLADWPNRLASAVAALPSGVRGVAVIYADAVAAKSPDADDVIRYGREAGCAAVLVDTHDKRSGGLLDLWTLDECRRVIEQVRARGMLAVMAGSLTPQTIARLLPLEADYVAVRGAVCRGTREGDLDRQLVRNLADAVQKGVMPERRQELARTQT